MHIVDDHIAHILESYASISGYMHIGATAIHGLVAIEDELVLELDHHARLEDDPEGLVLDDRVAEGARGRV